MAVLKPKPSKFWFVCLVPKSPTHTGLDCIKPWSRKNNFVEVSGHNLDSSQIWGFCMDFINHKEGGIVSCFPPFSYTVYSNRTVEIVEEVAWVWRNRNLKAKLQRWLWKAWRFLSRFRPRIRPLEQNISCLGWMGTFMLRTLYTMSDTVLPCYWQNWPASANYSIATVLGSIPACFDTLWGFF